VRVPNWIIAVRDSIPLTGLAVGALLFSLSLTPSLLPRSILVQGILSGCTFAVGYGIGAVLEWFWDYMQLGRLRGQFGKWFRTAVAVVCTGLVVACLYQTTAWQNSVREVMGAAPVEGGHPLWVLLVALVPAFILMLIGTIIVQGVQYVSRRLVKLVPPRVAFVVSLVIVGIVTATLFNGVLLRGALRSADAFFERLDTVTGRFGNAPPANPLSSGSAASLVAWDTIGRDGRIYVETGPSQADIAEAIGRPALEPLRVYVGMRSAPTVEERADLALAEMLRVGAFDRSVLVIITPVGTGWVDPPGIDSLEFLLAGDVASVAMQYSYLTSPLSLVVEPEYGTEAAQALFNAVYGYWTAMPHDARPKLYLNGLSLGAHASQSSTQVFDVLADPFQGALWVGPPFTSPIWRWATQNRQPDSPEWMPVFGNSSAIRFTIQGDHLDMPGVPWGPLRIAFLQYASDPVVFFEWSALYRTPDWLIGERGPDVSPALNWYPVVTFLQLGVDMALGQTAPMGHGHLYASGDYVDAWLALIEPAGWDKASLDALKAILAARPRPLSS